MVQPGIGHYEQTERLARNGRMEGEGRIFVHQTHMTRK
jgi:hypothetical protein